jgi:hypothetical protein
LKNKAPPFAERNDFLHQFSGFWFCHKRASVLDANAGVDAVAACKLQRVECGEWSRFDSRQNRLSLSAEAKRKRGRRCALPPHSIGNLIALGFRLVAKDAIRKAKGRNAGHTRRH